MKQIAEELGVGSVVEGGVRKRGDRARITAQLNDVGQTKDRLPRLSSVSVRLDRMRSDSPQFDSACYSKTDDFADAIADYD
jgi:TolB-like protein